AHVEGVVENAVQSGQHWQLNQHRQTAGERIRAGFAHDVVHFHLHALLGFKTLLILIFFFDAIHFRLQFLHFGHGDHHVALHRMHDDLDDDGHHHHSDAETSEESVEEHEEAHHHAGDPIDPADIPAEEIAHLNRG